MLSDSQGFTVIALDSTAVSREKQPNKSPRLGCQHHLVGTGDLVRTVGGDGDRGPMSYTLEDSHFLNLKIMVFGV